MDSLIVSTLSKLISPEMGLVSGAITLAFFVIIMAWWWRAWEDRRHDKLVSMMLVTLDKSSAKDRAKLELYEQKMDGQQKELVQVWSELDKCRRDCETELAIIKDRIERKTS